jgi:hypothetical protein
VIASAKTPLWILGERAGATLTAAGPFPIFRWESPRAGSTLRSLRLVGGGRQIEVAGPGALAVENCRLEGGESHLFAGGDGLRVRITGSFLRDATLAALEAAGTSELEVTGCTLHRPGTAGVMLAGDGTHTVRRTIVNRAGTVGILCVSGAALSDSSGCNDVFGSGQAGYSGCAPSPGDLSADPLFCDPEAGNFSLSTASPCLPDSLRGCDLIGALGPGCGPPPSELRGSPGRLPGSR